MLPVNLNNECYSLRRNNLYACGIHLPGTETQVAPVRAKSFRETVTAACAITKVLTQAESHKRK